MLRIALACLAPLVAPPVPAPLPPATGAEDLASIVARLEDSEPDGRRRAQRDLARALSGAPAQAGGVGSERVALEAALEDASPEACRRVARVLGREDRLLGLAAELCASTRGVPAAVGKEALEGQLARWSVSVFDEPEVAAMDGGRQTDVPTLPDAWSEDTTLRLSIDPVEGGAVAAFDRLDRLGAGPAPIVLDPRVVAQMVRRPSSPVQAVRAEGSWGELLMSLTALHGVAYQVQGYRFPGEERPGDPGAEGDGEGGPEPPPARPFVHVVPKGTTELGEVGRDLRALPSEAIVRWCQDLVREGDAVRQRAAARALAALDWPAAVQWLEVRWLERGDVPALEGLLAAAARGRVAPSLQRPEVLQRILRLVDDAGREVVALREARRVALADSTVAQADEALRAASTALDGRARRFAVGLARLAPVAVGGDVPLADVVLDGFDAAPPTGRWLRLVMLEGFGLEDPRAAAAARSVLVGEVDGRSRRQALGTLLAVGRGAGAFALPDPGGLFAEGGEPTGLGLELGLVGARPADGAFVTGLVGSDVALGELLVWAALVEEPGPGGELPPWVVAAARAAAARAGRRGGTSESGPLAHAARAARGDTQGDLDRLCAAIGARLEPRERVRFEAAVLAAGLGDGATRERAFAAARAALDGPVEAADLDDVERAWRDLAALVGDPDRGEEALRLLQGALVEALRDGRSRRALGTTTALLEAAERATERLRRTRRDVAAEDFADALRSAAGAGDHPLSRRLYDVDWPPPVAPPPRDLEGLEPELPPGR